MKLTKIGTAAAALAAVAIAGQADAQSREQMKIVGSSTVYPFSTAVAEQFGKETKFPTPVVESTGSGGGLKLFCAGVGTSHPDITNASRRIKKSEFETCQENGVNDIVEIKLGYDGIVVANAQGAVDIDLTREQLFEALAASQEMPQNWSDIDPSLPDVKIEVLGPPPTSGTRDAFEELALEAGCEDAVEMGGAEESDCEDIQIREDGAWVDAGENDNLIVSKLQENQNALGVFGFSFLDQNRGKLKAASLGGISPTFEKIADGDYQLSRSMYFYIKKPHIGVVPGIMEYAKEFVSDDASGQNGYLLERGLIPLPQDMHDKQQQVVENGTTLDGSEL